MPPIGLIFLLFLPPLSTQADREAKMQQARERAQQAATQALANPGHVCFAIRSYIFKREDGLAPVLVKTTTCTEAIPWLDRVSKPPRVKLVPADL